MRHAYKMGNQSPFHHEHCLKDTLKLKRNGWLLCLVSRSSHKSSREEKVIIESDHKPLPSIFKKSLLHAPCRLQRMMLPLQRFNLEVVYKLGSQMFMTDNLSRAFLKTQVQTKKSSRFRSGTGSDEPLRHNQDQ